MLIRDTSYALTGGLAGEGKPPKYYQDRLSEKTELFSFTGLRRPVAFINSESLYPHLFATCRDWEIKKIDPRDEQRPVITIRKTAKGFQRRSRWLSKPKVFRNPIDTVCDFIVDLIHAYVADNEGLLCLHCAAVKFNQGLVVFPNTYRAGKSILSLKLISCGGQLFTDDVLPITSTENFGMALGILPRLRLPLPEALGDAFNNFAFEHEGPKNDRYLYVKLSKRDQAVLGMTAPIRGITILQRDTAAKPALVKVKKSTVVRDVILRNFARQNPALEIVDRLYSIAEEADCYTLRYASLDQAVELLDDAFGLQNP